MERIANILLVEDDQLDTIDIKRSLEKLKILYNLHETKNGEEAIEVLTSLESKGEGLLPDVLLIDINMPRMNGLELLHVIRTTEKWQHLKCFMITTSTETVDQTRALQLGVSGYIVKPLKLNSPSSMDSFNLMIDLMNVA